MARKSKRKWYVVWVGTETGVCETWEECKLRTNGYPGARYKSFESSEEAIEAFRNGFDAQNDPYAMIRAIAHAPRPDGHVNYAEIPEIYPGSIAVDGASSGNPGMAEYRGVDIFTGAQFFHFGPIMATNNVVEFLAIVHALGFLKQRGMDRTAIYSDSRNALLWVRNKKCNTKLPHEPQFAKAHELIARAERWLQTNTYNNFLIKWKTEEWGEIPADFGRK